MTALHEAPPPGATAPRSRLKLALAWALGIALLGWLLSRTPLGPVLEAIQRPSPAIWALTLGGLLLSYGLRGARLQVVLGLDDSHPPAPPRRWLGLRTDALRVILLHNAAVNLLPMRAGELSFPWLASRELKLPVARAVVCLMWMRLQDLAVLAGLGLALWPGLPWGVRAAGLLGLVAGWHAAWWLLQRMLNRPTAAQPGTLPPTGWRSVGLRLQTALLERSHHRPAAWGLTLANWALKLAAGATLLSAISQLDWPVAWAGALGGELAAIFPLQGPAGFGTYEAGVWAGVATLLPHQSPSLAHVVGAALALHVCFLICAVCAAGVAALLARPLQRGMTQGDFPPRHPG